MTTQTQWEMAEDAAAIYENEFVPALFAPWARMIVDLAHLRPGQRVLDVACGTGAGVREIASRIGADGSIIGLDFTPDMLAVAREKSPEHTWVEGSACELPFDDDSFDAIVSLFGLMFFPDKAKALREMMRVLKPGGSMHVAVWHDHAHCTGYGAFAELLQRFGGDEPATWMGTPFSMGDIGALASLCGQAALNGATIDTLKGHANFPSIDRWITTQVRGTPLASILDEAACKAIFEAAAEEFTRFLTPEGTVRFDMQAHVITARKS